MLNCSGTVSFTKSVVYPGSLLHCDLSDDHDAEVRIKKASTAFRVPRSCFFNSSLVLKRLNDHEYAGDALATFLYGYKLWCLTMASLSKLCHWPRVAKQKDP